MKLTKAETAAIIITLAFIAFTAIYAPRSRENGSVVIRAGDEEASVSLSSGAAAASPQITVDINAASAEQLETLPGIGEALAGRIITYRRENGPFARPEDIMNVSGIGAGTYKGLKDYISAG
ncbi:MAG: ComEA family DNA-binding protein [Oscillospiraceae bacterium]|nr:ComEA family DNA-binding protein [Oscillospiraceae bacterium]